MEKDLFWELFRDTGDSLFWLLLREADRAALPRREKTAEQNAVSASVPR